MADKPILHQSLFGDLRPLPKPFKSPRTESRPKHLVWIGKEKGRRCRECGHVGTLDDFIIDNSQPDGVDAICRECNRHRVKQWHSENREQKAEYQAAYNAEHREERAAYTADRRRQNIIYWATHEPSGSKRCPRCETEKDVSDFYKNATRNDGLRVYCKSCANARNRERGSGYRKHWRVLLEAQGWKCNAGGLKRGCGRPLNEDDDFHVDHIHPVSKGGGDEIENLQVLCAQCNLRWSNRLPNNENAM